MKLKYVVAGVLLVLAIVQVLIGSRSAPGALTELQAKAEQRIGEGKPAASVARTNTPPNRAANPWRFGSGDDFDDQPQVADYVPDDAGQSEMPVNRLWGGPVKLAVAGTPVTPPNTALIER